MEISEFGFRFLLDDGEPDWEAIRAFEREHGEYSFKRLVSELVHTEPMVFYRTVMDGLGAEPGALESWLNEDDLRFVREIGISLSGTY